LIRQVTPHVAQNNKGRRSALSGFAIIENKERSRYISKLDVAGSIPVARSKFPQ
jgi:hypothetical protein